MTVSSPAARRSAKGAFSRNDVSPCRDQQKSRSGAPGGVRKRMIFKVFRDFCSACVLGVISGGFRHHFELLFGTPAQYFRHRFSMRFSAWRRGGRHFGAEGAEGVRRNHHFTCEVVLWPRRGAFWRMAHSALPLILRISPRAEYDLCLATPTCL